MRTDEHIYDENRRLKKELARVTQERDLLKKGCRVFCERVSVKYAWIKEHQDDFSG
jgi:hypothetical protein